MKKPRRDGSRLLRGRLAYVDPVAYEPLPEFLERVAYAVSRLDLTEYEAVSRVSIEWEMDGWGALLVIE